MCLIVISCYFWCDFGMKCELDVWCSDWCPLQTSASFWASCDLIDFLMTLTFSPVQHQQRIIVAMGFCCHGSSIFHWGPFREYLPENKFISNGHLSELPQTDLLQVCVHDGITWMTFILQTTLKPIIHP